MSEESAKGLTAVRAAIVLMVLGVVLFVGGWVYDVVFAGIPYPDPTPEQQANWDFHKTVASYIRFGAIGAAVAPASVCASAAAPLSSSRRAISAALSGSFSRCGLPASKCSSDAPFSAG